MKYTSYSYPSGRAEVAAFVVTGGVTEYHVMIHATDPKQTYREQMNVVLDAYAALLKKKNCPEPWRFFKKILPE